MSSHDLRPVDVQAVVQVVQFLTSAVIIPGGIMLIRRLSAIRDHLARINGSVADLTRWRIDHESLAEREHMHHEETRRQCRENLAIRLEHHDKSIEDLWGRVGDRRRYPQDRTD